ncbi:leucine-rich repeat domain-containing protein [Clostridium estertheticum]|uniref:leucine-rich repeat domain-containing protein n=1 Tax=Clostridium estertheticum TaxID=238834 RepID=UPI0013E932E5|nr:leucine-rich repeat domain-containing protein [Clostridium estertheticum]MBZ9688262.1 leucine-rich repeat domain-containing protein [Clostridium estertheticum]
MTIMILIILGAAYGYGSFRLVLKNYVDMTNIKEISYSLAFGLLTFFQPIISQILYYNGIGMLMSMPMLISITVSLIFLYESSKAYKSKKNGKHLTNAFMISIVIFIILSIFLNIIISSILGIIILANWLLIKKLPHDIKFKLSIVFLIIGILMLISGIVGINTTSQKAYQLGTSIEDTITNNVNTYLKNISEDLQNENEMYWWLALIGGFIALEGIILFIGSGKKQKQISNNSTERNRTTKNENSNIIKEISKPFKDDLLVNKSKETDYELSKIIFEKLDKEYNLLTLNIITQENFNSRKSKILDTLKSEIIKECMQDFIYTISPLVDKNILTITEIKEISQLIDKKQLLNKLTNDELFEMYLNPNCNDNDNLTLISAEIKGRGSDINKFKLRKELIVLNDIELFYKYKNNELEVAADILYERGIGVKDVIYINRKTKKSFETIIEQYVNSKDVLLKEASDIVYLGLSKEQLYEKFLSRLNTLKEKLYKKTLSIRYMLKNNKKYMRITGICVVIIICFLSWHFIFNRGILPVSNTPNVSPTVGITFSDKNLELLIRSCINKPTGDILKSDLDNIRFMDTLNFSGKIADLSGIENLTNLTTLDLSNNLITNIEPLKGLTNLTCLHLSNNQISNIESLKGLTKLVDLKLDNNPISSIESLNVLTNLTN